MIRPRSADSHTFQPSDGRRRVAWLVRFLARTLANAVKHDERAGADRNEEWYTSNSLARSAIALGRRLE
ncbi:MAG: hypothetical protein ABSH35_29820 [Isosphaeraceae bacterium]|jgi:hypothetical protein